MVRSVAAPTVRYWFAVPAGVVLVALIARAVVVPSDGLPWVRDLCRTLSASRFCRFC